jgi:hypothetical protein
MSVIEAMKLALEALKWEEAQTAYPSRMMTNAISALQKALANEALDKMAENARELGLDYEPAPVAEPRKQEPVAWMTKDGEIYKHECWPEHEARPLVFGDTSPPAQRTWVSLTDEERAVIGREMAKTLPNRWIDFDYARAVEAKLKEKNT